MACVPFTADTDLYTADNGLLTADLTEICTEGEETPPVVPQTPTAGGGGTLLQAKPAHSQDADSFLLLLS